MIDLAITARRLAANAEAVRVLLGPVSDEQAEWQPGPEDWSLLKVMEHLYNEERLDFRRHLKEMFSVPPQAWGSSEPHEHLAAGSLRQALDDFLAEREASLAWLGGLEAPEWPDWDVKLDAPWGAISAGDVLVSWVEHDFLHLRQINELLYAWEEQQARPYSVQYAGGW